MNIEEQHVRSPSMKTQILKQDVGSMMSAVAVVVGDRTVASSTSAPHPPTYLQRYKELSLRKLNDSQRKETQRAPLHASLKDCEDPQRKATFPLFSDFPTSAAQQTTQEDAQGRNIRGGCYCSHCCYQRVRLVMMIDRYSRVVILWFLSQNS